MKIAREIAYMIMTGVKDGKVLSQDNLAMNIAAKLEPIKNALILLTSRLDYQWYQTDPFPGCSDSVKKGEHHPWVKEIEATLTTFKEE